MSSSPKPADPARLTLEILDRVHAAPPDRALRVVLDTLRRRLRADGAGLLLEGGPHAGAWRGTAPSDGRVRRVPLGSGWELAVVGDAGWDLAPFAPVVRLALHAAPPLLPLGGAPLDDACVPGFPDLLGRSTVMQDLGEEMQRAARVDLPVLLLGETGTGKDVVARSIHAASRRARKPFVPVHCGALPEALVESELFGHVRGSFTGSVGDRTGLLETADGGTALLDEIGELPAEVQVKLLRFLQSGEVRRLGASRSRDFDVRILAATHRDLRSCVEDGSFRQDLYYRLGVLVLTVPPLRARGRDVALLAERFLAATCGECEVGPKEMSEGARERLLDHDWPGNVRELENVIRAAAARAGRSPVVSTEHLGLTGNASGPSASLQARLDRFEAGCVAEALEKEAGNRTRAARRLGITRQTLHTKIRKYLRGQV